MAESLGPCCACGRTENVRNVLMLDKLAPIPGTGWGCVVCHAPQDGAVAVLCDDCLENRTPIKFVVAGFAARNARVPIETVTEPFGHNMIFHREVVNG